MVIAFTKRSENPIDVVSEGLHAYVIPNLREHKVKQGDR